MADTATTAVTNPLGAGLGGVLSLIQGLSSGPYGAVPQAQQAAALADPFAAQRGQYQTQLSGLLSDPNSFKSDPGYQFALNQGLDTLKGQAGATYGTSRVGGVDPELMKYAEGYASQNYDNRINQLMQLSGSTTGSPATAGQILAGGFDHQSSDLSGGIAGLTGGIGALLGKLPDWLSGLTGGSSGGNRGGSMPDGSAGLPGQGRLNLPFHDIPDGGSSDYGNLIDGSSMDYISRMLGLGGATSGYNPMAGFQIPGGLAGLFGVNPTMAQRNSNIMGETNYGAATSTSSVPGLGSLFSQTQGGGAFGSIPWGSLFGGGGGGGGAAAAPNPDDWSGWMTRGGGGGGGGSIDWSTLFGGGGGATATPNPDDWSGWMTSGGGGGGVPSWITSLLGNG